MTYAYPVRRRRPRADHEQALAARVVRRRRAIAEAVLALGADVTHAGVAQLTGVPLGYLEWAYPTVADLCREAG